MQLNLTKQRIGEICILGEAFLWGLFPVLIVVSQATLSPLVTLSLSSLLAACFFGIVLTSKKKWHELQKKETFVDMLLSAGILGIGLYLCYFIGLQYTSPGNASIIALAEIFFSYLFFHVWKKEALIRSHITGAILIVLGVLILFIPSFHTFQLGDVLILIAAMIAPFGNFFQRRARTTVSSETILFVRSLVSGIFVLMLAWLTHASFSYSAIQNASLILLINGVVILGFSKMLWIEGIHRISVMKANALNSTVPLITLLFSWVLLHKQTTIYQMLSFIPVFFGIRFLSKKISTKITKDNK